MSMLDMKPNLLNGLKRSHNSGTKTLKTYPYPDPEHFSYEILIPRTEKFQCETSSRYVGKAS